MNGKFQKLLASGMACLSLVALLSGCGSDGGTDGTHEFVLGEDDQVIVFEGEAQDSTDYIPGISDTVPTTIPPDSFSIPEGGFPFEDLVSFGMIAAERFSYATPEELAQSYWNQKVIFAGYLGTVYEKQEYYLPVDFGTTDDFSDMGDHSRFIYYFLHSEIDRIYQIGYWEPVLIEATVDPQNNLIDARVLGASGYLFVPYEEVMANYFIQFESEGATPSDQGG